MIIKLKIEKTEQNLYEKFFLGDKWDVTLPKEGTLLLLTARFPVDVTPKFQNFIKIISSIFLNLNVL